MSNKKRVVVTGFGAISPLGNDWESVSAKLKSCTNAVQVPRLQMWGRRSTVPIRREQSLRM